MKNNDKATQTNRIATKTPVNVIIEREFIGEKSVTEIFIPIIYDDIRKTCEQIRTLDNDSDVI